MTWQRDGDSWVSGDFTIYVFDDPARYMLVGGDKHARYMLVGGDREVFGHFHTLTEAKAAATDV
jgi:hypothetical protein